MDETKFRIDSVAIKNILDNTISAELKRLLESQRGSISLVETHLKTWSDNVKKSLDNPEEIISLTQVLLDNLDELFAGLIGEDKKETFSAVFSAFGDQFQNYLSTIPKSVIEIQKENNFKCDKGTKIHRCILLKLKTGSFNLNRGYVTSKNKMRKVLKKEQQPAPEWKRKIQLQNLQSYYFKNNLILNSLPAIIDANQLIEKNYHFLYNTLYEITFLIYDSIGNCLKNEGENFNLDSFVEKIDSVHQIFNNIDEHKILIDTQLSEVFNTSSDKYSQAYENAGTVKHPSGYYDTVNLNKISAEIEKKTTAEIGKWKLFRDALAVKWEFLRDISSIKHNILTEFLMTEKIIEDNQNVVILPYFNEIRSILSKAKTELSEISADQKILPERLAYYKTELYEKLSRDLILNLVEKLSIETLVPNLKNYLVEIEDIVLNVKDKQKIIKSDDLNFDIKESDFESINPKEIITEDSFRTFSKDLRKNISEADKLIKEFNYGLMQIDQIADYNLETALSIIKEDKKEDFPKALETAVQGIERALNKNTEILEGIKGTLKTSISNVRESTLNFTDTIAKLTKAENLLKIKIKISKLKAAEKIEQTKKKTIQTAKNLIPIISSKIKENYSDLSEKIAKIRNKIGISTPSEEISLEITDFLLKTEELISGLPLVYQRLFRNEPLHDKKFFIGREEELAKIKKAYLNWEKGRFSSIALINEKGSGASTLINFACEFFNPDLKVCRTGLSDTVYSQEKLLILLKDLLDEKEAGSLDDLLLRINSWKQGKIVIIENFEELYLKIVGGFEVMKTMFEIIHKSGNKIFWLLTCNKYAWKYLDKVLDISDYFAFKVDFRQLGHEQIEAVIMKRHAISGYGHKFLPSDGDTQIKSFKKLSDEEKQTWLKKKFFTSLSKISEGNISLAQLYWLRSIDSFVDDLVHIASISNIEFSFLRSLETYKLFTLSELILHDGLTLDEHALALGLPPKEGRLRLFALKDDGIVMEKNGTYTVNYLLYGPIVNLLKDKNILH